MVLDALALGELCRVDELVRAELLRPRLLAGVRVDRDDAGRAHEGGGGDDPEPDRAAAENRDGGALCSRSIMCTHAERMP